MSSLFGARRWEALALVLMFALALAVRFYDVADLPLDFHPTRQLFAALKARGMYYQSAPDVAEWQREESAKQARAIDTIEPPVMETLTVWGYRILGEHLWLARVYSIVFWMIGAAALYAVARRLFGVDGALLSLGFFLFLPYAVFASRSFQPDPLMVCLIVIFWWGLLFWHSRRTWTWTVVAGLLGGLAVLVKSPALFFIAGAAAGLLLLTDGWRASLRNKQVWALAALAVLPAMAYYIYGLYIAGFLEGQFGGRFYPELLLSPLFYLRWELNIAQVMGHVALALTLLGLLLVRSRSARGFLLGLLGGYVLYSIIFAYHTSSHDYYQLPLIPVAALALAPLGQAAAEKLTAIWGNRTWARLAVAGAALLLLAGVAWDVRMTLRLTDYRPQAAFWEHMGDLVEHQSATVVLSPDYGYRLNYWGWTAARNWPSAGDRGYQADKSGSAQEFRQLFTSLTQGARYFLVADPGEFALQQDLREELTENYPVLAQGDGYILFDLTAVK
jgi:4-amino-4-deoxy-L-arabinose transferase-like glycosyltransferase